MLTHRHRRSEQEEVIEKVKQESQTRNRQYEWLLMGIVALSAVL